MHLARTESHRQLLHTSLKHLPRHNLDPWRRPLLDSDGPALNHRTFFKLCYFDQAQISIQARNIAKSLIATNLKARSEIRGNSSSNGPDQLFDGLAAKDSPAVLMLAWAFNASKYCWSFS